MFVTMLFVNQKSKSNADIRHIGMRFTVNEQMMRYKLAQIDKKKVPLLNVEAFAVGDSVRVASIQKGALVLKAHTFSD